MKMLHDAHSMARRTREQRALKTGSIGVRATRVFIPRLWLDEPCARVEKRLFTTSAAARDRVSHRSGGPVPGRVGGHPETAESRHDSRGRAMRLPHGA